jgi:hypothetical protein
MAILLNGYMNDKPTFEQFKPLNSRALPKKLKLLVY